MTSKSEIIPSWEFGPGAKLDFEKNRLVGVSGKIYENVQINVADLMREFPEAFRRKSDPQ